MEKKNVLILCGGNSCRSQMAEGYFKFYACKGADVYSAGLEAKGIHNKAVEVMAEVGIDLRGHSCNTVSDYKDVSFDYVITVCDVDDRCPVFEPTVRQFHYNFPDPTMHAGSETEVTEAFREVRDLIKTYVEGFVQQHIPC